MIEPLKSSGTTMSGVDTTAVAPSAPSVMVAAKWYRDCGLAIARIRADDKRPTTGGWSTHSAVPEEFAPTDSIGIQTGWLSNALHPGHSLVCVDLDSTAALDQADTYLPPTKMIEGRASKRRAHRYYLVPVASIPEWAVSRADLAAAAAIEFGMHPGAFKKQFRTFDDSVAIDFLGTGGQAVAPPSVHSSGELREWEDPDGIGNPAVIDFMVLWTAVCVLAKRIGCRRPVAHIAPGFDFEVEGNQGIDVKAAPNTSQVVNAVAKPFATACDVPLNLRLVRARAYLAAIVDNDLSRAGHGGHDHLFRHVSAIVNGLLIRDRAILHELFEGSYNSRLRTLHSIRPADGFEPWTPEELAHKFDGAELSGPPPGKAAGWLASVSQDAIGTPMAWDNPRRLAEEFSAKETLHIVGSAGYLYCDNAYEPITEDYLRLEMRSHAENAAKAFFDSQLRIWNSEEQPKLQSLERIVAEQKNTDFETVLSDQKKVQREIAKLKDSKPTVAPPVQIGLVSSALESVRALRRLPEKTPLDVWLPGLEPKHYLRVLNGILDLDSLGLHPHSPNWLSLVSLPVAYDPNAASPGKWLKFLFEVQEGDHDRINLLQEIAGCCLDRQLIPHWFVFLTGDGDNGKSAFLRVLKFILGDRNCSAVNLSDLADGGNRFARFDLYGKLANLKGDQSYFESEEESALKELTGGDIISFEKKFQQPIYGVNTAKLVHSCNQLPTFKDKTNGIWRRFMPVPFNWAVPAAQKNTQLDTIAYWREELSGILNWMLQGLTRYRGRGEQFVIPQICRDLVNQHKQDSSSSQFAAAIAKNACLSS